MDQREEKRREGKKVRHLRVVSLTRCEGSAVSQGHRVERRATGEHTFAVNQVKRIRLCLERVLRMLRRSCKK